MATKANATVTLFDVADVDSTTWYYLLQSSTASPPAKPTTATPSSDWKTTEPAYTEGSTNTLYTVMKTTYSDETFEYSEVSKSSSYEAAKAAYNKAIAAAKTATNYIQYADGVGIVVGDMTASTLGNNVLIDSDSVDIRNGETVFSSFNSKGIDVYGEYGEGSGAIALSIHKSDDSTIRIEADTRDLSMASNEKALLYGGKSVTVGALKGHVILDGQNSGILIYAPSITVQKVESIEDPYYPVLSTIDGLTTDTFCADFVVEQGTKGIWTYRKWSSGIAECWGGQSYSSMAVNQAYGNLYYHQSSPILLPFTFRKLANIQATVHATTSGLFGVSVKNGTSTSQIAYYITSAKAEASANLTVELHVSGRWK